MLTISAKFNLLCIATRMLAGLNLLFIWVYAVVLDGTGSLCWYPVLPRLRRANATERTGVVTTGSDPVSPVADASGRATPAVPDIDIDARLIQLLEDVAEGKARATVTGIRNHLGCAQETAVKLNRQLQGLLAAPSHHSGGSHVR